MSRSPSCSLASLALMLPLFGSSAGLPLDFEEDPVATNAEAIALPELGPADLNRWRVFARPSANERGFDELDWSHDLASGLVRAGEEQKPLLLWLMNGHPLGCT